MRIAVYSGSFDPLHIGHLSIMEHLLSIECFEAVYLVVSPQSPFKDVSYRLSAQQRFDAAVAAAGRYPSLNIVVSDVELSMAPPYYTIRTLDTLSKSSPSNSFTLVIGADQFAAFKHWSQYKEILVRYGIVVYPRSGFDLESILSDLLKDEGSERYRIRIMKEAPLVDISSTEIREALSRGEDISSLLM